MSDLLSALAAALGITPFKPAALVGHADGPAGLEQIVDPSEARLVKVGSD